MADLTEPFTFAVWPEDGTGVERAAYAFTALGALAMIVADELDDQIYAGAPETIDAGANDERRVLWRVRRPDGSIFSAHVRWRNGEIAICIAKEGG